MAGSDAPKDKKDLTGMYSLPAGTPAAGGDAVPDAPPIETVDSFDSMAPDMSLPEPNYDLPATEPEAQEAPLPEPVSDFDPFDTTAIAPSAAFDDFSSAPAAS